jgi:hypothetical protein
VLGLDRGEVAEVAVEPVVGVLRTAQVLNTTRSATAPSTAAAYPASSSSPVSRSESCTFIWQPYVRTWYVRVRSPVKVEGLIRAGV